MHGLPTRQFLCLVVALLWLSATASTAPQQLIDRQRVIDAINAVPTTAIPRESCSADGSPNGVDEDGDGAVDEICRAVQPPCAASLAPASVAVPAAGGTGAVALTLAPAGCVPQAWAAESSAGWLTVSPPSGSGSAQVGYAAASNGATTSRTGTLTIAGRTATVTQDGVPPPQTGGQGSTPRYPLEITNIKPAGTGGLTANNRIYWAHSGLRYEIRAAVIGGSFPYPSFTLSNAPAGMTVDGSGVVVWENPQGSATPTLTVRDFAGTAVSATWTVTVSDGRFRFVDAINGNDANAGTQASPWRTLSKVYSSATGAQIVYFRAGTYVTDGIPVQAANNAQGEEYIAWDGVQRSVTWLAYPGDDRPTLDFAYTGPGQPYSDGTSQPRLKINGPNLYVAGMRFYRCMTMCFQVNHGGQAGTTFWRNVFAVAGPGIDGGNSAQIMFVAAQGANSLYTVVQENDFSGVKHGTANSSLKLYTLTKPLFEDNHFSNNDVRSEGLAIKAAIVDYTVRNNTFHNVGFGIGGNMNRYSTADTTRGEMLFNTVVIPSSAGSQAAALTFNQNSTAGQTFIERNTFVGRVWAFNVDSSDGPFTLVRNVIVNVDNGTPSGSHVLPVDVQSGYATRVIHTENLTGFASDGLVDGTGKLQGAVRTQWLGQRGAEIR